MAARLSPHGWLTGVKDLIWEHDNQRGSCYMLTDKGRVRPWIYVRQSDDDDATSAFCAAPSYPLACLPDPCADFS